MIVCIQIPWLTKNTGLDILESTRTAESFAQIHAPTSRPISQKDSPDVSSNSPSTSGKRSDF